MKKLLMVVCLFGTFSSFANTDIKSEIKQVLKKFSKRQEVTFIYEGQRIDGYLSTEGSGTELALFAPIYEISRGVKTVKGAEIFETFTLNDGSYELRKKYEGSTIIYSLKNQKYDERNEDYYVSRETLKVIFNKDLRFGEYISKIAIGSSNDGRKNPELIEAKLK